MKPLVSIIMGSLSDMPVMEEAIDFLKKMEVPIQVHALSAHRTPDLVATYAKEAAERGVQVIIAGAGGAAHLPGIIAAHTCLPVIGVPIRSAQSLAGLDSVLSILQMPSGIPVATMAINGARNAAIYAVQILALADNELAEKLKDFRKSMAKKVEDADASIE